VFAATVGTWLLCGEPSIQPLASASPQTSDAWLEAKPACVFPLASQAPPASREAFMTALSAGLQHLAVTPAGANLLSGVAIAYPAMKSLRIDLSDCVEDDAHKPPKVNWHFTPQPGVRVQSLEIAARPLIIKGAKLQYELTAADAQLKMAEDRANHPLLMLMGATDGHFSVTAGHDDVQALCLAAAKQFARKYGFSVKALSLEMTTPTPRTLDANVVVTLDGAMGGKLYFTGRFSVTPNLNATASKLTCRGDGPGGMVISSLLSPGLMFYDGKTKPLVSFPFDGMKLRDVKIHVDGDLHIDADFGEKS
jgi:hypothetical protein